MLPIDCLVVLDEIICKKKLFFSFSERMINYLGDIVRKLDTIRMMHIKHAKIKRRPAIALIRATIIIHFRASDTRRRGSVVEDSVLQRYPS